MRRVREVYRLSMRVVLDLAETPAESDIEGFENATYPLLLAATL